MENSTHANFRSNLLCFWPETYLIHQILQIAIQKSRPTLKMQKQSERERESEREGN